MPNGLQRHQRKALIEQLRVAANGELVAEKMRCRLCDCLHFEPYNIFRQLQADCHTQKVGLSSCDLQCWLSQQPHKLAHTHMEDIEDMLAHFESYSGQLHYNGFLNMVLPRDPSHLRLREAVRSRNPASSRHLRTKEDQIPLDIASRLCQIFDNEINVSRQLKFHGEILLDLGTSLQGVCKFLDAGQGICAGMAGLISLASVKRLLVDELRVMSPKQCSALLRRINPSGACLAPSDDLAKVLSISPLQEHTQVTAGGQLGSSWPCYTDPPMKALQGYDCRSLFLDSSLLHSSSSSRDSCNNDVQSAIQKSQDRVTSRISPPERDSSTSSQCAHQERWLSSSSAHRSIGTQVSHQDRHSSRSSLSSQDHLPVPPCSLACSSVETIPVRRSAHSSHEQDHSSPKRSVGLPSSLLQTTPTSKLSDQRPLQGHDRRSLFLDSSLLLSPTPSRVSFRDDLQSATTTSQELSTSRISFPERHSSTSSHCAHQEGWLPTSSAHQSIGTHQDRHSFRSSLSSQDHLPVPTCSLAHSSLETTLVRRSANSSREQGHSLHEHNVSPSCSSFQTTPTSKLSGKLPPPSCGSFMDDLQLSIKTSQDQLTSHSCLLERDSFASSHSARQERWPPTSSAHRSIGPASTQVSHQDRHSSRSSSSSLDHLRVPPCSLACSSLETTLVRRSANSSREQDHSSPEHNVSPPCTPFQTTPTSKSSGKRPPPSCGPFDDDLQSPIKTSQDRLTSQTFLPEGDLHCARQEGWLPTSSAHRSSGLASTQVSPRGRHSSGSSMTFPGHLPVPPCSPVCSSSETILFWRSANSGCLQDLSSPEHQISPSDSASQTTSRLELSGKRPPTSGSSSPVPMSMRDFAITAQSRVA